MTNKLTHLSNHTVTAVLATDTLDATELDATIDENLETQTPWQVIVYVFRAHFGFSRRRAEKLMLQVHNNGKAVVFTGSREDAEKHTQAMHAWGLMASFEKAEN